MTRRKNRPDDNIGMRRRLNPGRKQTDGNTVRNNRKITDWAGITVMMTRRCKRKTEDTETGETETHRHVRRKTGCHGELSASVTISEVGREAMSLRGTVPGLEQNLVVIFHGKQAS